MSFAARLGWHENALIPAEQLGGAQGAPADPRMLLADSWRVLNGTVIALPRHFARFTAGARSYGIDPGVIGPFLQAVTAALPRTGDWFPRIQLEGDRAAPSLSLLLRPTPALGESITVTTDDGPDVRTQPGIKGPDLDALLAIRERARQHGADEAIILDASGRIVDGTSTALAWWRDDVLCMPPDEATRVDSVTARVLRESATALEVPVRQEAASPADLDGVELWALNALHGIRLVTRWSGGPPLAATPGRLHSWRTRLEAMRIPLERQR